MSTTDPRGLSAQLRALADFADAHPDILFDAARVSHSVVPTITPFVDDLTDLVGVASRFDWKLAGVNGSHFFEAHEGAVRLSLVLTESELVSAMMSLLARKQFEAVTA